MRCGCGGSSECGCFLSGGNCVSVAGAGSQADPYVLDAAISGDADNAVECRANGLYVPDPGAAAWIGYTPTWSSDSNPQPVLGNGTIVAAYRQVGKTLDVRIFLTAGTTTTFGTDGWLFSLPGALVALVEQIAGSALAFDSSVTDRVVGVPYFAASAGALRIFGTSTTGDSWEPSEPFTWANSDKLWIKSNSIEIA